MILPFLKYLFIVCFFSVLLLALACSSLASALTCDSLKDFYKCNESDEKLVNIGGVDYSCKDGFVCNAKYRVVESLCSAWVNVYCCNINVK